MCIVFVFCCAVAGKKCLVLDIDYTLFDLNSSAEHPDELARPYLHDFLTACYEYYDIIIWSATNMKWVEVRTDHSCLHGGFMFLLRACLQGGDVCAGKATAVHAGAHTAAHCCHKLCVKAQQHIACTRSTSLTVTVALCPAGQDA